MGEHLAGIDKEFKGTLGSAAIKVLTLEAGRTGISEEEAKKMGINYKTVFIEDKNQTSYYPGQEDIFIKIIYNIDTRVLLGGQIIGKKMGINYKTVFIEDKNQTSYYPGQEDIFIKIIYNIDTRVLLGGQIIGKKGAVLRVDVLAAAIDKEMTVDELAYLDLCYAPPFSLTWDPLN